MTTHSRISAPARIVPPARVVPPAPVYTPRNLPAPTYTSVSPDEDTTIALVYDPNIGIIGHLRTALWSPNGTTKREMVARLTELFPDRDPVGMTVTVGIQLGRLQKKWGKIVSQKVEGRGRVYGFEGYLNLSTIPENAEQAA